WETGADLDMGRGIAGPGDGGNRNVSSEHLCADRSPGRSRAGEPGTALPARPRSVCAGGMRGPPLGVGRLGRQERAKRFESRRLDEMVVDPCDPRTAAVFLLTPTRHR